MNAQEKRLTEEQSAFAEKHHHVVMDFLRRKRLPESEFYDVVIFRYLRAVHLYCIPNCAGTNSMLSPSRRWTGK